MHFSTWTALLKASSSSILLQGLTVIIGTFILEDATTVLSAIAVQGGTLAWPVALASLYVGIVLGDLGLYGLGALAARWPYARRWISLPKRDRGRAWFAAHTVRAVAVSRFIPGARLPVYTACGFFGAPFGRFAATAVGATLVWTSALFAVSLRAGHYLLQCSGSWRWIGIVGFTLAIIVIGRLIARLQTWTE
ncbi:DedA family protein [Tanticharoenia sakaeratensis]|jgi:membrane protein DedA with SNARE-associated domain|uniref:VTT domain-containing protein n=1 Tax=Tanticharoenia sakaeratensis NBRC 103193 TaxID=1231623 RepID=A0A0D6MNT5_9PROT|nr:VTT domain-containing protein [Tanticharoenia sakaeratensis]GAN54948.1 hypothetical protein Tasa_034_032 [Tanticharoenia sakaeratensis NBRC 103193]GBQ22551.1 hypothetical protein AA103193_2107 [Tanticharoenia sakaeratensis NBRC 103193]